MQHPVCGDLLEQLFTQTEHNHKLGLDVCIVLGDSPSLLVSWQKTPHCLLVSFSDITPTRAVRTMRLSVEDKWNIVSCMKTVACVKTTATRIGCSAKAVRRWWKRYITTSGVDALKGTGRTPALSQHGARMAMELLLDDGSSGAAHVARSLSRTGVSKNVLHKSTVIRAARKAALQQGKVLGVRRGKPPKCMTQLTMQKRLNFAKANRKRAWGLVLFTDRKKFHFHYPGSRVKPVRWVVEGCSSPVDQVWQPSHAVLEYICRHQQVWDDNHSCCGWL
jgi:hypothetical protein